MEAIPLITYLQNLFVTHYLFILIYSGLNCALNPAFLLLVCFVLARIQYNEPTTSQIILNAIAPAIVFSEDQISELVSWALET